jgi:hypothetical protein
MSWHLCDLFRRRKSKELETILHVKGKPCPEGYVLVNDLFSEPDGSREDAYVRVGVSNSSISIDYLLPGEGVEFSLAILPPLYSLGRDAGGPFIRCTRCGRKSYNPNDIREKYCGWCHMYHGTGEAG